MTLLFQNVWMTTAFACALLVLSACQQNADHADDTDHTASIDAPVDSAPAPTESPDLAEAKTPKALTQAIVALSEDQLKDQLICAKLDNAIDRIDHKSQIEALRSVARQLDTCLPKVDDAQRLVWLHAYQAMMTRFLNFDAAKNGDMVSTIARHIARGKVMTVAQLKQVSPRTRYLLGVVRSHDEIDLVRSGTYVFGYDLQMMADLFAPYLSKSQAAFIERMAEDNQQRFLQNGRVAISSAELVARASFWADYIARYPDSYFIDDAKYLFHLYRRALFLGTDRTQWTDDSYRIITDPAHKRQLIKLLKRRDDRLAKDAQIFFAFMNLSDEQRQAQYPITDDEHHNGATDTEATDKNDDTHTDGTIDQQDKNIARHQLRQALDIPKTWDANKDCFSGIICLDR